MLQKIDKLFPPTWIYMRKCQAVSFVEIFFFLFFMGFREVFFFVSLLFIFRFCFSCLFLFDFWARNLKIFVFSFDFLLVNFLWYLLGFRDFFDIFEDLVIKKDLALHKLAVINILVQMNQIFIDETNYFVEFPLGFKLDAKDIILFIIINERFFNLKLF